jgi:hypothetical protein
MWGVAELVWPRPTLPQETVLQAGLRAATCSQVPDSPTSRSTASPNSHRLVAEACRLTISTALAKESCRPSRRLVEEARRAVSKPRAVVTTKAETDSRRS